MLNKNNINCILLCGGKGTRMQSETKHKVCFEIDGVPAILRSLDKFYDAGIGRFIVVVGALPGQVIECIGGKYPNAAFVYQKEQKGTGNAALIGYKIVEKFNVDGPVIITMGDKITDSTFIRRVVKKFQDTGADFLVSAQPKETNPHGGRIVLDETGKPVGIREEIDTKRAIIYKKVLDMLDEKAAFIQDILQEQNNIKDIGQSTGQSIDQNIGKNAVNNINHNIPQSIAQNIIHGIEKYAVSVISNSKKRDKIVSEISSLDYSNIENLRKIVEERAIIKIGGREFDAEYVDNSKYTNASFYMLSNKAAQYAFPLLNDNNAQKEEYITDIVEILASTGEFKLEFEAIKEPYEIMGFNNVEELLKIEDYYRHLRTDNGLTPDERCYKPVKEWIDLFENADKDKLLYNCLAEMYGEDDALISERKKAYLDVLKLFADKYGAERKTIISRAPGRINIMGRHIDHRGGNVNVMSINKEVIAVAAVRDDDRIRIINTNGDFKERDFCISEHLIELDWDSWLSYLESGEIEKMVINAKGDWANYVKAPILRLQYQFRDRKLKGMDMAFTGNIPIAAGLSSSSAIVVSTAEAFHVLNNLNLTPQKFVELCGEGEWYVGSRGGAADHAAMKFAKRGHVVKLGFLPFNFEDMYSFPEGYKLIIANSHVKSNKTTNSKDAFNSRIASYEFGVMIFKEKFPQFKGVVKHLRDINTNKLGLPPSKIYELLLQLPEKVTPDELFDLLCGGKGWNQEYRGNQEDQSNWEKQENQENCTNQEGQGNWWDQESQKSYESHENYKKIKRILASHNPPDYYYVRTVTMFGVAECCRARLCKELLDAGKIVEFGKMMNTSHNGDRAVYYDKNGTMHDYDWGLSDAKLEELINDLRSENPERVLRAQIEKQPGGYACSVPEIDYIVDVALGVDGVMGAQLSGAGLGG
ncbi:MAG TPA: galactokinase family protein, partial [Clostridiales bacterium]|nr:galactokinase family protein [Clostridiales bacterium]